MQHYKSHKIVEAAKVCDVDCGTNRAGVMTWNIWWGDPDGDDDQHGYIEVDDDTMARIMHGKAEAHQLINGYIVRYEDGYVSWSSAPAFEAGYSLAE